MSAPKGNHDWPDDAKYPGTTADLACVACDTKFFGHHQRLWCRACHLRITGYDKLSPAEQEAHDKRALEALHAFHGDAVPG